MTVYFHANHPQIPPGHERAGPASILSFLPVEVLLDNQVFVACEILFFLGAALWAGQRMIPWSGWLTALGFTAVAALHHEAADQATHGAHLTNMMLFVYALWYQLYSPDIRAAVAKRRFWSTPLFPHWVYVLSLFSVGLFYGLSGWSKLARGGLYWPNGLSLQLWVTLWGDANSFWTGLILSSRTIARLLQLVTLALELGTPLVIVVPGSRRLIGLGLLALHVGVASVLGFGFHANAAIIAMVLVVQPNWLSRLGETPRPGEV